MPKEVQGSEAFCSSRWWSGMCTKHRISNSCSPGSRCLLGSVFCLCFSWYLVKVFTSRKTNGLLSTHLKKISYSSVSSSVVKLSRETFVPLVIPQDPLYFQYIPVGNCLATASLTEGISISSQADGWLCLQAALLQCQQTTEIVPHIHKEREKMQVFFPQNWWVNGKIACGSDIVTGYISSYLYVTYTEIIQDRLLYKI